MKLRLIAQLVLSLCVTSAHALPVMNMSGAVENTHGVDAADCQQKSQFTDLRAMVQQVNIIGDEDDRKAMSMNPGILKKAARPQDDEQEMALACTGRVVCQDGKYEPYESSGSFCAPGLRDPKGKCRADRIVLSAHMFVPKGGTDFNRKRMEQCQFVTYRGHVSKIRLEDMTNVMDPAVPTENPYSRPGKDPVTVRLEKPIPNCNPPDIDPSPIPPSRDSELIVISFPHEDQLNTQPELSGSQPVVYKCSAKNTFGGREGGPTGFATDCDIKGGGSGSFVMTRNAEGQLVLSGVLTSEYNGEDRKPYGAKNYTLGISLNNSFIENARVPGVRQPPQMSQSDRPLIHRTGI